MPLGRRRAAQHFFSARCTGLTAVVRGVPDYRNTGINRAASIISIVWLMQVFVDPRLGAKDVFDTVHEPQPRADIEPPVFIDNRPDQTLVDVNRQLFVSPP
jgi:hypothetical protein